MKDQIHEVAATMHDDEPSDFRVRSRRSDHQRLRSPSRR